MARIPLGWMQKWVSKGTTLRGLFPASMGHARLVALLQCSVLFSLCPWHAPAWQAGKDGSPCWCHVGSCSRAAGDKGQLVAIGSESIQAGTIPMCPFQQQGLTPWACGVSSLHPHADCIRSTGTKGEERQKVVGGFTARGCGSPPQCLSIVCPC